MTMNISYYTIDDLKLPAKRPLRKGWTMERFPTLEAALERYRVLPASGIKALGLTDGTHVLELVKCLPLFPDDKEGESVLASDYRQLPLWSSVPEAASATDASPESHRYTSSADLSSIIAYCTPRSCSGQLHGSPTISRSPRSSSMVVSATVRKQAGCEVFIGRHSCVIISFAY